MMTGWWEEDGFELMWKRQKMEMMVDVFEKVTMKNKTTEERKKTQEERGEKREAKIQMANISFQSWKRLVSGLSIHHV